MSITHEKVSTVPDGADTSLVRPSDWNAAHAVAGYVAETLVDAKGDLLVGSAADIVSKLTVGADDSILMADAAQATGLKWVSPAVPSTQAFGDAATEGTADTFVRGDHKHAMPANPVTAHEAAADPHTGYRLESADHSHASTGLQAGKLDHGAALDGLGDDDHPQYARLAAANTFTLGPQTLQTGAAGNIGLIVRGAASQSANLQEWQNSAGSVLASIQKDGRLGINQDPGNLGTMVAVQALDASTRGLIVRGAASQSAALQEWQDSAGTMVAALTAAGLHKWSSGNEQTTVGAAGGASAPPATPTKYLKVVDSAGTTLVVPAYAAA